MNHWAYLLVWIDTRTGRVVAVGIYSEETPTTIDRGKAYVTLMRSCGDSFDEAYKHAERYYAQHPLSKVVRLAPQPSFPARVAAVIDIRGSRR